MFLVRLFCFAFNFLKMRLIASSFKKPAGLLILRSLSFYGLIGSLVLVVALGATSPFAYGQDITVSAGSSISVVADSQNGQPSAYPCGTNFGQNCYAGTMQPNGSIQWTLDGSPVNATYENVVSNTYDCTIYDDNWWGYQSQCTDFRNEAGYTATLPTGDHTLIAFIPVSQDQWAAFTTTWHIHVISSQVPISMSLDCSPSPLPQGQSATCTASVPPGTTGVVDFNVAGNPQNAGIDGNGHASISGVLGGASAGSYSVTANYGGDATHSSASAQATVNVFTPVTVTSVTPSAAAPGDLLEINGSGFGNQQGGNTLTIGGVTALVTYWSNGRVVVEVPQASANGSLQMNIGGNANSASFALTQPGTDSNTCD